jgi:DNA adenine methylase
VSVITPPIKSQGIKTKLVPWIKEISPKNFQGKWIEPFMGTGSVGFNLAQNSALMCDINPHLVNFYESIKQKIVTAPIVKEFLIEEGSLLKEKGENHYYEIRERFNRYHHPLDFLFINRACFNGIMRFNRKGGFNVPFCRKSDRFAQAYVTKIVNQVAAISKIFVYKDFTFECQPFEETIKMAGKNDVLYCDPPYIDRHVDYYGGWNEENEFTLYNLLKNTEARFVLSTWHRNDFRENLYIQKFWNHFHVSEKNHFYHVGGSEKNRNPVIEALVTNYAVESLKAEHLIVQKNLDFFLPAA